MAARWSPKPQDNVRFIGDVQRSNCNNGQSLVFERRKFPAITLILKRKDENKKY
jgi:hypothetical protein